MHGFRRIATLLSTQDFKHNIFSFGRVRIYQLFWGQRLRGDPSLEYACRPVIIRTVGSIESIIAPSSGDETPTYSITTNLMCKEEYLWMGLLKEEITGDVDAPEETTFTARLASNTLVCYAPL